MLQKKHADLIAERVQTKLWDLCVFTAFYKIIIAFAARKECAEKIFDDLLQIQQKFHFFDFFFEILHHWTNLMLFNSIKFLGICLLILILIWNLSFGIAEIV